MVRQFTFFGVITVAAFGCMTLSNGPMMGYDPPIKVGVPVAIWAVISWIAFRVVNVPRIAAAMRIITIIDPPSEWRRQ
jgi:hypothetical protein